MKESDGAAIERTLAGDGEGFRLLVERYSHVVFRLAYRMTGNESDADDAVQETFLRAYRNLATYDSRASFSTWLYRIATNFTLDQLAARKRRYETFRPAAAAAGDPEAPPREAPSHDAGPDRLLLSREIRTRVAEAMEELTPQERAAFTLRHLEHLPVEEIGEALQLGSNATRNSIFRAVQKLRRNLADFAGVTT